MDSTYTLQQIVDHLHRLDPGTPPGDCQVDDESGTRCNGPGLFYVTVESGEQLAVCAIHRRHLGELVDPARLRAAHLRQQIMATAAEAEHVAEAATVLQAQADALPDGTVARIGLFGEISRARSRSARLGDRRRRLQNELRALDYGPDGNDADAPAGRRQ